MNSRTNTAEQKKAMPVMLIKPGTMEPQDIKRAEEAGFILILECTEPEAARFLELPASADIDAQARAALSLMRTVMATAPASYGRSDLARLWAHILLNEQAPASVPAVKR